jgi:hypothetical protein
LYEEVPRQKAAESRKIPEPYSVIPREGVERRAGGVIGICGHGSGQVIPREGVVRKTTSS